jgi:hypothetical protein
MALSKESPAEPSDPRIPASANRLLNAKLVYWLPRMLSCLSSDRFGWGLPRVGPVSPNVKAYAAGAVGLAAEP